MASFKHADSMTSVRFVATNVSELLRTLEGNALADRPRQTTLT